MATVEALATSHEPEPVTVGTSASLAAVDPGSPFVANSPRTNPLGSPGGGIGGRGDAACGSRAVIASDSIAGPALRDPMASVMPRGLRTAIFALICQGVQAFMSYDGGATPASLDTIQAEMDDTWSPAEFGLLGSMDKIGMTVTSMLWGRCLQLSGAKVLLCLGLLANAACTAAFGSLRQKGAMYAMKFVMGATQSLQGVWSTVWTVAMAPPDCKTTWLGLGAVSSGVGNGIGTAVAGFGTANGLSYAFAFQVQAAVLGALWVFLLVLRPAWLSLRLPKTLLEGSPCSRPGAEQQDGSPSTYAQLRELSANQVYCWTSLAISMAMFEMSGIQFLWVRVFVEVWGLHKNAVTLAFLLVSGIGGGIGIAFGPRYIDRGGGYDASPGVVKSLQSLSQISVVAALAGIAGVACLLFKLRSLDQGHSRTWDDHWLWMTWASILLIMAAHNACVPALCGINVEAVPPRMRAFSSGIEMTIRNILGYSCGPLLPGIVMNLLWRFLHRDSKFRVDQQLGIGLGVVFLANLVAFWVLRRALAAAKVKLVADKSKALERLREAFQAEDIAALERAVTFARSVDLHTSRDGEAVMGMANEVVGAYHALGSVPRGNQTAQIFERSKTWLASPEDLRKRVLELEKEVTALQQDNVKLHEALGGAGPRASGELRLRSSCTDAVTQTSLAL